jgi:hypothetical protein
VPPFGFPPPPLVVLPLVSPSPISIAIWAKKPEAERTAFSTTEMRNYRLALEGNNPNPGGLVLMVATGASEEPKCFLTARMNSATVIPKIELIHSLGNYVVALGQPDDLHGHTFAFVGEQVGNQLPSTFLEPTGGGALAAFAIQAVDVPSAAAIDAHYAQANPPIFLPSDTPGIGKNLMDVCMIPLSMWAPYFIGGSTPKETLDKVELLVAAVPAGDRAEYQIIQDWVRYACGVAAGTVGAEVNQSMVATDWRDFLPGAPITTSGLTEDFVRSIAWPKGLKPEPRPSRLWPENG